MRPSTSDEQRSTRRLLAGVGFAVLVLSTTAFVRVPLLPDIGRELSMSAAQLGVITSMYAVGRLVTDLPAGRLLDRLPPMALLSGSAMAMFAGSLALAAASRPGAVYAAAFALGISSAVTNATGMHAFSGSVRARRRGTALAVYTTALLGGQALGPLVGGGIAAASSWRVAVVVAGLIGLAVAVATFAVWRQRGRAARDAGETVQPALHHDASDPADTGSDGPPGVPDANPDANPDTDPVGADAVLAGASARWPLLAVAFSMFFSLGAMPQTLVPVIGATELGLGVATIGVALGVGGGCRLIGGFIGGTLADRVSRRAALLPGLALQALGVALLVGEGVAWWVAAIVLMSLASWSISTAAAVLADLAPHGRLGRRLGSFRFVGDVGLITGPLVAGQMFELVGRTPTALTVAGLLLGTAAWCAVSVPETIR